MQAAGVTKGTFYFHFAHKEDILLEVGWGTSDAMFKEATQALARNRPIDESLDEVLGEVARRVSRTPRVAVARTLEEFYRRREHGANPNGGEHGGFQRAYAVVFFHGQESGQLPADIDARGSRARCCQSLTMGAIHNWINDEDADLAATLRYRATVAPGRRARSRSRAVRRPLTARRSEVRPLG